MSPRSRLHGLYDQAARSTAWQLEGSCNYLITAVCLHCCVDLSVVTPPAARYPVQLRNTSAAATRRSSQSAQMSAPSLEPEAQGGLAEEDLWAKLAGKAERLSGLTEGSLIRADYTYTSCIRASSCSSESSSCGFLEQPPSSTSPHGSTTAESPTEARDPAECQASTGFSPPVPWWFLLRSPVRFGPWAQPCGHRAGPDLTALLEYNEGERYRCQISHGTR